MQAGRDGEEARDAGGWPVTCTLRRPGVGGWCQTSPCLEQQAGRTLPAHASAPSHDQETDCKAPK